MSYLDRLKRLENGEIFHYAHEHEPTKPTKAPFDGFVGATPGANENIHAENDVDETGNEEGLIFEKVTRPLPTKPSEGVDPVASAGEPPKSVLSPSGLWYFTPPAPLSPPMSAPGDIGLMDSLEVEF